VTAIGDRAERPLGLLVKTWPKLSETFILEEVLGLERRAVPLRLYALAPPADAVAHSAVARVRAPVACVPAPMLRRTREFAVRHVQLAAAAPLAYLRTLVFAWRRGARGVTDFLRAGWLAGQLRADGVRHLHTHFISEPADVAELVSRLTALPFSISAHAKDIYLADPVALRRKLRAAAFTVTCTELNRRTLAAIAPEANVHRMYHGIDHDVFHPGRREGATDVPLILAVGRLRAKKGFDTLIDACALLHARGLSFRCEIVGYGEEREHLLQRVAEARLAELVTLPGKLAREQVIDRYARAAVFVQPSRIAADGDRDGIPNVLLEAMAMSVPVIATGVSGIPELVSHAQNGLLIEPDAAGALAQAIAQLLERPHFARELGAAARATVTEWFDNDHNLKLLTQLLETSHACSSRRTAA